MRAPRGRRLNLVDAMILVAATAIAIFAELEDLRFVRDQGLAHRPYREAFDIVLYLVSPSWLAWTFACLVIRLRRPRPAFRRMILQPGTAAGLAASVYATIVLALGFLNQVWQGPGPWPLMTNSQAAGLPRQLGPAVFGSWLVLGLARVARPEPGSIDRMGVGLGAGWILLRLAQMTSYSD